MTQKELNEWFLDEAENGDAKRCKHLLEIGAHVNVQDNDGWTATMFAAWYRHADCLQMLIEAGANLSLMDNYDKTALHYAKGKCRDIIEEAMR